MRLRAQSKSSAEHNWLATCETADGASTQLHFLPWPNILSSMPSSDPVGFRWLRTGDETFAKMLSSIDAAKTSIELESYIYSAGPIGERFRDALIRACHRGVRVQVLI